MTENPRAYLRAIGERDEDPLDIARTALMLSALDHPDMPLELFDRHLDEIARAMKEFAVSMVRVGDGAFALSTLLSTKLAYDGDRLSYDEPKNADLITVIERRRGLPVALGILYMHAARAGGMTACGLDTQGHFLVRVGFRHDEMTIDPFNGGAVLEAGQSLPAVLADAHLAKPVGDIDVLLRLQNNLKMRALQHGDTERALEIADRMALVAPRRPELWFDLGRLNEAMGVLGAARRAYERCLEFVARGEALHNEAAVLLAELKRRLN
jgi:regulator of sirC expression with transglutaminase-like and TPR domain